jgi:hypothetical protein
MNETGDRNVGANRGHDVFPCYCSVGGQSIGDRTIDFLCAQSEALSVEGLNGKTMPVFFKE